MTLLTSLISATWKSTLDSDIDFDPIEFTLLDGGVDTLLFYPGMRLPDDVLHKLTIQQRYKGKSLSSGLDAEGGELKKTVINYGSDPEALPPVGAALQPHLRSLTMLRHDQDLFVNTSAPVAASDDQIASGEDVLPPMEMPELPSELFKQVHPGLTQTTPEDNPPWFFNSAKVRNDSYLVQRDLVHQQQCYEAISALDPRLEVHLAGKTYTYRAGLNILLASPGAGKTTFISNIAQVLASRPGLCSYIRAGEREGGIFTFQPQLYGAIMTASAFSRVIIIDSLREELLLGSGAALKTGLKPGIFFTLTQWAEAARAAGVVLICVLTPIQIEDDITMIQLIEQAALASGHSVTVLGGNFQRPGGDIRFRERLPWNRTTSAAAHPSSSINLSHMAPSGAVSTAKAAERPRDEDVDRENYVPQVFVPGGGQS
jgi:hypothetical protein